MKYYSSKARQAGMTLIELTVVLLVLIGLAGLMIPYVAGFISKTHDSTGDSNLAALNGAIARFEAQYGVYPDDLQLLALDSGGTATMYSKLMKGGKVANGALAAVTYSSTSAANQIQSLANAGMTKFLTINPQANTGAVSATFAVANTEVDTQATGFNSIPVATVGLGAETYPINTTNAYPTIEDHLADAFGMNKKQFNATCYDYVVFGVGQESQLTGKVINDAPVHFAQNANMGPAKAYNRLVAVFQVQKATGTQTAAATNSGAGNNTAAGTGYASLDCPASVQKAKFIGTAMIMNPPHLWGLSHSFGHTYNNLAADTVQ